MQDSATITDASHFTGNVKPAEIAFVDKLVERNIACADHIEQSLIPLDCPCRNVGRFALDVLAGCHTPDGGVEGWRPIAAVHADRFSPQTADRVKAIIHKVVKPR